MNICIIYKGTSPSVRKYLDTSQSMIYATPFHSVSQDELVPHRPDIIIVDIVHGRGERSDTDLITSIVHTNEVPLFLVTGSGEGHEYREQMLNAGVDGCIQVPFLKEELQARLHILYKKRTQRLFLGTTIRAGGVEMNIHDHVVAVGGEQLPLTRVEYSILFHLLLHKRSVVRLEELKRYLGNNLHDYSTALNVHILNLRKKIGEYATIQTVPQYGFMACER